MNRTLKAFITRGDLCVTISGLVLCKNKKGWNGILSVIHQKEEHKSKKHYTPILDSSVTRDDDNYVGTFCPAGGIKKAVSIFKNFIKICDKYR